MATLPVAYRLLTNIGIPLINIYLRRRLKNGREDSTRFPERKGTPSLPRPSGKLVWCHAASVGEAMSLLALINKLRDTCPQTSILVTTGTVTSATLMAKRLPSGAFHQYVPVDRAPWVEKFLNHWQPDLAIWIESELWPNMLAAIRKRQIPAALLNARMSEKSFRSWQRFAPAWSKELLSTFSLILAQTERDAQRLSALSARQAQCVGNLKFAAAPPSCNETELASLRKKIGQRPVWLMASTHPGEEELALSAHKSLSPRHKNLLTIIVPRHPARGDELERMITQEHNLRMARRAHNEPVKPETEIYLADTLGELGLLYRLSPIVVMGGSFLPDSGGHNPIEPAQLGAAIILGPNMKNFEEVARAFLNHAAAIQLNANGDLASQVENLMTDSESRKKLSQAALNLTAAQQETLGRAISALQPWLDRLNEA